MFDHRCKNTRKQKVKKRKYFPSVIYLVIKKHYSHNCIRNIMCANLKLCIMKRFRTEIVIFERKLIRSRHSKIERQKCRWKNYILKCESIVTVLLTICYSKRCNISNDISYHEHWNCNSYIRVVWIPRETKSRDVKSK